jgi:hypothetical protein
MKSIRATVTKTTNLIHQIGPYIRLFDERHAMGNGAVPQRSWRSL